MSNSCLDDRNVRKCPDDVKKRTPKSLCKDISKIKERLKKDEGFTEVLKNAVNPMTAFEGWLGGNNTATQDISNKIDSTIKSKSIADIKQSCKNK